MSIPVSIDPLGTLEAVTELDSCGIAHNALINTGINGQVRNMRLVMHVGGVPTDGTIASNYVQVFGCEGGCRRYVRFGSGGGVTFWVFTSNISDWTHSIQTWLERDMQFDVTFGTSNVTAVINGQSFSAPILDFTEPAREVKMFWFSSLSIPVVFRFYRARIYLNDELSADIVPARQGEKIILWDKVRHVRLEPTNSPLLP